MTTSPASFAPSLGEDLEESGREPLSLAVRRGLLALVIFFHVGIGWALTQVEPTKLVVGESAPMEVRMVPAERPSPPQIELPPPPEDTPPPEPQLESMIQPPMPNLPPPVFPVDAPPPKPKPPPPKPKPKPAPAVPLADAPQTAPPQQAAMPQNVAVSQVTYINKPAPIYPMKSRRAGEQGRVMVRLLIDITGRPTQVSVEKSSGHPLLDESAMSAVRAALFKPFTEAGVPRAVWVVAPINFNLQ